MGGRLRNYEWAGLLPRRGLASPTSTQDVPEPHATKVSHSEETSPMSDSIIYVGMDVHKDSITMAILPDGADGDAAVA